MQNQKKTKTINNLKLNVHVSTLGIVTFLVFVYSMKTINNKNYLNKTKKIKNNNCYWNL